LIDLRLISEHDATSIRGLAATVPEDGSYCLGFGIVIAPAGLNSDSGHILPLKIDGEGKLREYLPLTAGDILLSEHRTKLPAEDEGLRRKVAIGEFAW
jgi:hypothetical protein